MSRTPLKRKREFQSAAERRRDQLKRNIENNKKRNRDFTPSIILSFGTGDAGQLGLGEDKCEVKRPCIIPNLENVIKVSSGGMHTVTLNHKGEVHTFGCNDEGALGRFCQNDAEAAEPGLVKFPIEENIIDITAGDSHSSALSNCGNLYVWGTFRDNDGAIGLMKPYETVLTPVFAGIYKLIIKIVSGDNHIAILIEDGSILTFGCGENGQLGRIPSRHLVRGGRAGIQSLLKPGCVRGPKGIQYCDVWAGCNYTVARTITGELYGCGLNNYKQLLNIDELSILMMTPLNGLNSLNELFRNFEFGQHHLIGVTESNRVFTIGRGEYGSLGLGNNENIFLPQEIKLESEEGIDTSNILNVYSNNRASYILLRNGTGYSWGNGDTWMLSHGDENDVNVPTKMLGKQLKDKKIVEISPGAQHVVLRVVEVEPKLNPKKSNENDVKVPKPDISNDYHVIEMKVAKLDATSDDHDVEMKDMEVEKPNTSSDVIEMKDNQSNQPSK